MCVEISRHFHRSFWIAGLFVLYSTGEVTNGKQNSCHSIVLSLVCCKSCFIIIRSFLKCFQVSISLLYSSSREEAVAETCSDSLRLIQLIRKAVLCDSACLWLTYIDVIYFSLIIYHRSVYYFILSINPSFFFFFSLMKYRSLELSTYSSFIIQTCLST